LKDLLDVGRPHAFRQVACLAAAYQPRHPDESLLYQVVAEHLETFLARQAERDRPVPGFVCGNSAPS
jgi:hypothetical protein